MTSTFSVVIKGQPVSVNHVYASRGSRRYKLAGVESYQVAAAALIRLARPKGWLPGRQIIVHYWMWLTSSRMDCSNHLKVIEDAIAAGLGVNDSIFLPQVHAKEVDKANPRIRVMIENIA